MLNVYQQFKALLPDSPLQVGTVTAAASGVATVQLPGGGRLSVRGTATVGQKVFVRDGVIQALASDLPIELIEI